VREEETPEGRTLYVAVGRNKPTRPDAEQTVEGVRNAEDGKVIGCGRPVTRTPLVDVAKRARQPQGRRLRRESVSDGQAGGSTLKRREGEEDEPVAKVTGDDDR